jgi:hypothetical protein
MLLVLIVMPCRATDVLEAILTFGIAPSRLADVLSTSQFDVEEMLAPYTR